MRTSHTAIRRMIHNEKNKLTDEQIFASARFAAYLTDIAEGITKRYRRSSRVVTFWDTSERAPIGKTNNRIISLNCGNRLSMSFPTRSLKADSLLGIIGHECGHILFSDFSMLNTFQQAIRDGRFYPHEPTELSELQQNSLDEILSAFAPKDEAVCYAVSSVSHSLVNIMEDVFIESKMCSAFPGAVKTGILLNNFRFAEEMTPVQQEIDQQHHGVFVIINLLIQYAKTGDILNLNDYKGPYLDALYQCIPYLDDAAYDDDARIRYDAANHMLLILWPFMKSYIDQIRKDRKNHTSHAEEAKENQLASGLPLPNLTGKPIPASGKIPCHSLAGEDDCSRIKQVLDYEDGRMPLQKTDNISEDGSGGISHTNDYSGAGYVSQAAEDMDSLMTRLAEEIVYTRYEKELTEELQKEAEKIRYGNAHKGIHVNVNRMSYVDSSYMTAYQQVSPQLLLISKRLQGQVSQLLKDYKYGGRLDNLPFGKRINVRNTIHNDGRIFYKMKLPNDQTDMAVAILNDESGSMSSANRITYARCASIILLDFCRKLDIPVAIYGHSTSGEDVELYAYAEYNTIDGKDAFRLMDMSARNSNRDGAALRYVAERLLTRPEAIKLLILISDGQPAAYGYHGTEAEADLRGIKKEYSNKGIRMFAAAIGDDKPNIQRIYGDGFLDITDLEKLPLNLGKLMIQHIKDKMTT
ncbi:MAG TPA: nitric oxide reductase activation protein NorD [Candidatus Eisenbergiella merdavium]|uniref:Nitric oxide reductase activation protein NorD n=1 Tax=Candidatus Eisenbergiella merdavium TaxID=2838551 RepID=A0A9D2ND31_9FIRM|nr:nitric oxide reductase activation protein NorD [Candidatus Eisenbergiella merdavium]